MKSEVTPDTTASIRPVETFHELATNLEAALARVLGEPDGKAVHVLRTSTRRLEAQLELLRILPEMPEHASERMRLLRSLKKVRRASGTVRDLDVMTGTLTDRTKLPALWTSGDFDQLAKQAVKLAKHLVRRRERQAANLRARVDHHRRDLPAALEGMLHSLEAEQAMELPEQELVSLAHRWFAGRMMQDRGDTGDEALHELRKGAKLLRYLLESAPGKDGPAHRAAAEFEAVQEAGGSWHDMLTLAVEAADLLGKRSLLARATRTLRDQARTEYLRSLNRFGLRI